MPGNLAWIVNPRSRRRKAKSRRHRGHRSAAQRAATARMLAARFGANPRRRRGKHHYRRNPSKRSVRRSYGRVSAGAMGMLKTAAIMGTGAVLVDIGMGNLVARFLPSAATPTNADGTTNWMYFAAKGGLAVALGMYGGKVLPGGMALRMAEGALGVLAYQILRGLVPSGITLGYLNPAPVSRPLSGAGPRGADLAGVAAYLGRTGDGGAVAGLQAYDSGEASAARAANIVALARRRS